MALLAPSGSASSAHRAPGSIGLCARRAGGWGSSSRWRLARFIAGLRYGVEPQRPLYAWPSCRWSFQGWRRRLSWCPPTAPPRKSTRMLALRRLKSRLTRPPVPSHYPTNLKSSSRGGGPCFLGSEISRELVRHCHNLPRPVASDHPRRNSLPSCPSSMVSDNPRGDGCGLPLDLSARTVLPVTRPGRVRRLCEDGVAHAIGALDGVCQVADVAAPSPRWAV